jgi:hypothetical protein
MKKTRSKLTALMLALVMVFTCIPVGITAYGEETAAKKTVEVTTETTAEATTETAEATMLSELPAWSMRTDAYIQGLNPWSNTGLFGTRYLDAWRSTARAEQDERGRFLIQTNRSEGGSFVLPNHIYNFE